MKEKNDLIDYWIQTAEKDLITAEHLFQSGDYHYCLYIGHLVLEKLLKALYVKNVDNNAPYKHSLSYLAEKSLLKLTQEQKEFLEEVTDFNIEARYPDRKLEFYNLCTKEFTEKYFDKIKGFAQWLKSIIQSSQ